ncbi:MAG TPA: DNA-binding transcriptional regulator [Verrucomicrobiae bacterium]|jgi:LacI family transcriptional regulator
MKKIISHIQRPRVALLIESSRAYGRATLSGIGKYLRAHSPWSISIQEQSLNDDLPDWFKNWKGDGIITRIETPALAGVLERLDVPVVFLRNVAPGTRAPSVLTDNPATSRKAFEHLRERGFRHFAFCGFNGADYSDERRDSFIQFVTEVGLHCHVFGAKSPVSALSNTTAYEEVGLKDGEQVAAWLKTLPKPIGLMACNDMRGQQVLDASRECEIAVPDDIAVVGVDNEEVLCELSNPSLSSVVPNAERVGYEAAALLAQMMAGKKIPARPQLIEPSGVITRGSTEVLAIEDRKIAVAARFIREHACEGIDVSDVLRVVSMSRSALDRHFSKIMGHSPKDEILRVRLNRAKQLLAETDFSQAVIAEKICFEHVEYLSRIFKKRIGITPSEFRARSRVQDQADALPGKSKLTKQGF